MGVTEIPKLLRKVWGQVRACGSYQCSVCWDLTHSQLSPTGSPQKLNPKIRIRMAESSCGTTQRRGRMYLAHGESGCVPTKRGHGKGLEESTRGKSSVIFHEKNLPSLNENQKLLFKRQGGTLGWQENVSETKKEWDDLSGWNHQESSVATFKRTWWHYLNEFLQISNKILQIFSPWFLCSNLTSKGN